MTQWFMCSLFLTLITFIRKSPNSSSEGKVGKWAALKMGSTSLPSKSHNRLSILIWKLTQPPMFTSTQSTINWQAFQVSSPTGATFIAYRKTSDLSNFWITISSEGKTHTYVKNQLQYEINNSVKSRIWRQCKKWNQTKSTAIILWQKDCGPGVSSFRTQY